MPSQVDYYFSLHSPWSYLGHSAFIATATKHAAHVVYRPVPLGRLFPETGGLPLAQRHRTRQDYRMLELQRWREKLQITLQLHPKFWPSIQASWIVSSLRSQREAPTSKPFCRGLSRAFSRPIRTLPTRP